MRPLIALACVGTIVLSTGASARHQGWVARGPEGGHVEALEIDPKNPSLVYAATTAGVYKSADGGRSWRLRSAGLPTDVGGEDLEVAASNPSTLFFRGQASNRLFKSTNGAGTWHQLHLPDPNATIEDVEVDPTRATRVYLSTWEGLFRSDDGAASWQALPRFRASQFVAVAPSAPNVLYAEENGLFRSMDFGTTWARVWPDSGFYDAFAIDPRDANTIYFGLRTEGLWKSTDGGRNARLLMATHGLQNITEIAIDPRNPQRIIAGGDWGSLWGLFRTTDGGQHWKRISTGLPRLDSIRELEASSASGAPTLAGFFAGGVFRTTSGGGSWRPTNRGLAATPVRALVVDPGSPSTVYAGLDESSGVARSTNAGRRWSRSGLRARSVFALAATRHTIFAGTTRGVVYRTRNRGSTWHELLSKPGDAVVALTSAPSAPRVIYGAFYKAGIFRSADGGDTWRAAGMLPQVQTLAVQPGRPNTIFAGWAGTVARSRNGGRTWKRSADPVGAVKAFAADPARPNILYAAVEAGSAPGGVYKSVDGGANWVRTVTGITTKDLSAIAIDRHRPTTIYAGGCGTTPPGGVYRSTDAARTWTKISTGMTTTCVSSITLTPSGRMLHIGTLGGGVFTKKVR